MDVVLGNQGRSLQSPHHDRRYYGHVVRVGADPDKLRPYTDGAFSGLFNGPTSASGDRHLVVYSLRDLPDELKPIGTLLVLDAVWRRVSNPADRRPRLVVVDEAWLLMRQPAGADFLFRMAKSSRKYWAGVTIATQDTGDVLASDLGKAIVTNAATQILLRQAPQAIDEITAVFGLSAGERQFLLGADRGQGLLTAGTQRVAFQALASQAEHALITTNPAELVGVPDDGFFQLAALDDPAIPMARSTSTPPDQDRPAAWRSSPWTCSPRRPPRRRRRLPPT